MKNLTEKISAWNRDALIAALDEAEVPIGPVNDVAEILADPHVRARGLVGSFDYPGVGEFKALALPYKFLGWDNPEVGAPPALGADTDRVLGEMLGYSAEKIGKLRSAKAV
jgi:crotonobetainyl-CoA:carnitine CoA-transferase CaiB-like acyl-CoA transferase